MFKEDTSGFQAIYQYELNILQLCRCFTNIVDQSCQWNACTECMLQMLKSSKHDLSMMIILKWVLIPEIYPFISIPLCICILPIPMYMYTQTIGVDSIELVASRNSHSLLYLIIRHTKSVKESSVVLIVKMVRELSTIVWKKSSM